MVLKSSELPKTRVVQMLLALLRVAMSPSMPTATVSLAVPATA